MRAIIPAAGEGRRLRPFTHTRPKPLLPVAGKAILAHIIDDLIDAGITDFSIVVGYMGELIENYIKQRYGNEISVRFVVQKKLLGLGYAVLLGLEGQRDDEPIIVALGDTIVKADLTAFIERNVNCIGLHKVHNPRRFGVASLDNQRITTVVEKPEKPDSDWAITGLYLFRETAPLRNTLQRLLDAKKLTLGELQLTDAIELLIEKGEPFVGHIIDGWFDCGTSESLLSTNRTLLEMDGNDPCGDDSIFVKPVWIAATASVRHSIIGPYVSVGDRAHIERAIVRDSIIGEDALVKDAILQDTIIGNQAIFEGNESSLNLGDSSIVQHK